MKTVYGILLLTLLSFCARASHLRGGEIRASFISGQTYQINVRLYVDQSIGMPAESMSTVKVCMGDGSTTELIRTAVITGTLAGNVAVYEYAGNHTFRAAGIYQIAVAADQRSSGILNLPNSETTTQFIWTVIDTQQSNSTPVLPYLAFEAGVRQVYALDLKPSVADSDSITVRVSRISRPSPGECGVRMHDHSYIFPNEVSATGTFKVDAAQQKLIWTAPEVVGNFLFAMVVTEWRAGARISETYREGVITVSDKPGPTVEVPAYESAEFGDLITSTPNVKSAEVSMAIQAYPVPTDDFVTVKAYSKQRSIIRLQLIDMNGRVLHEIASRTPQISVQEKFDMRNLVQGVYLIRASNEKDAVTQKVLR